MVVRTTRFLAHRDEMRASLGVQVRGGEGQVSGAEAFGATAGSIWERRVKKGRHRRFEEARSLKRAFEIRPEPCPECGAPPDEPHASWCLHDSEELEDEPEEEEQRYR